MSDYKRLVAYIYLYDNGNRIKNIGFTKVESKNRECRIQVHIKGAWMMEGECCQAYIFHREKGKLKGIPIGMLTPRNGAGELKAVTDPENIMGSGLDLGQMAGIVILTPDSRILATRWDDGPVSFENFVGQSEAADKLASDNVLSDEAVPDKAERDTKLNEIKEKAYQEEEARRREKIRRMRDSAQQPEEDSRETKRVHMEQLRAPEEDVPKEGAASLFKRIRKGREREYPFGREAGGEYVSLEPADLLVLQDIGKYLVNNSFLLHGFYNYGHILLGFSQEDEALVLGVPGEFYVQEKIMASLFGFPEFRKTVDAYGNMENMGYWLRKIEEA